MCMGAVYGRKPVLLPASRSCVGFTVVSGASPARSAGLAGEVRGSFVASPARSAGLARGSELALTITFNIHFDNCDATEE